MHIFTVEILSLDRYPYPVVANDSGGVSAQCKKSSNPLEVLKNVQPVNQDLLRNDLPKAVVQIRINLNRIRIQVQKMLLTQLRLLRTKLPRRKNLTKFILLKRKEPYDNPLKQCCRVGVVIQLFWLTEIVSQKLFCLFIFL